MDSNEFESIISETLTLGDFYRASGTAKRLVKTLPEKTLTEIRITPADELEGIYGVDVNCDGVLLQFPGVTITVPKISRAIGWVIATLVIDRITKL